jgi:hypothetical protein
MGPYPPASLVVMKIHELATMVESTRLLRTLPLPDVDEILSKPGKKQQQK